jgi:hypothetical protein
MVAVSFWGFFADHDCTERQRDIERDTEKTSNSEIWSCKWTSKLSFVVIEEQVVLRRCSWMGGPDHHPHNHLVEQHLRGNQIPERS